jgi:hypothetical protein
VGDGSVLLSISERKENMPQVGVTNQGDEVLINEFWQGQMME